MTCRHGENSRVWPQSRMDAATRSPASMTTKSLPRSARFAAAASPTGPAPMMTTGNAVRGSSASTLGVSSSNVMVASTGYR